MTALRDRVHALVALLPVLAACGSDASEEPGEPEVLVTPATPGEPWETLSEWNLFRDAPSQSPATRVVPYGVNSPLFSDFTAKHRFLWVPEGTTIRYDDEALWVALKLEWNF